MACCHSAIPIDGQTAVGRIQNFHFDSIAKRSVVRIVKHRFTRPNFLRFDLPGLSRGCVISPVQYLGHFIACKGEAFMGTIRKFLRDENGATAIEYGLIAAGISVAIIATVTSLGGKLVTTFGKVSTALN